MDILQNLILKFPQEWEEEFLQFLQRQKLKKDRMDAELFALMRQEENTKSQDFTHKLYGSHQLNTYQALRKRLSKQVAFFILLKQTEGDQSQASQVRSMLAVAHYLIDKHDVELAWHFLKKAEEVALSNEQYMLLNEIYSLQLEHADASKATPLNEIIARKLKYRAISDEEERISIVYARIKNDLQEAKLQGNVFPFESKINALFLEYGIDESMFNRPKVCYQFLKIVRSNVLVTKNFYDFEAIVSQQYQRLLAQNAFSKHNHFYKLQIQYILCHTLYRNRKFDTCLQLLEQFKDEQADYHQQYIQHFYAKFFMLTSSCLHYTGRAEDAIKISQELQSEFTLTEEEKLILSLNTAHYYFSLTQYAKALKSLSASGLSDKKCEKTMGREWLLKRNLMEMMVLYELEHYDVVLSKIELYRKNFSDLLKQVPYSRVLLFIQFIKSMVSDPNYIRDLDKTNLLIDKLTTPPKHKEDLQAMSFYAWIKAKLTKKSYYETVLELVKD